MRTYYLQDYVPLFLRFGEHGAFPGYMRECATNASWATKAIATTTAVASFAPDLISLPFPALV